MEEVLTGETQDTSAELERRATELVIQLGQKPSVDPKIGIAPKELAATIIRTLTLPEIAALRPRLVPELTVFGSTSDGTTETLISGIADAVAPDGNDGIEAIVDWKSDVEINSDRLAGYLKQLGAYRRETGAERAILVLMTAGKVVNV
jgi:exodeoxyribonuclease-5